MSNRSLIAYGCLAGLVFLVLADVHAAPLQITPSLKLRGEFHDNLFFAQPGAEEEEYIGTASPGIKFSKQSARYNIDLAGRAEAVDYTENNDLNAVDRFASLGLRYNLTENFSLRANGDYAIDSQIDRDIEITGLVLSAEEREKQSYGGSANFSLSETSSLSLSYGFNQHDYVDPEFSSFKASNAGFGLTHNFSKQVESAVGRLNGSFIRYDYSGFQVEKYSLTLGGSFSLSEKYSLLLDIGPRYSRSEFEYWKRMLFNLPGTEKFLSEENDGWGTVGNVSLSYRGEVSHWKLAFSKDLAEASGRNGTTERTTASLELGRSITDSLSVAVSGSYYINESETGEFAVEETDTQTWHVNPKINYRFNRDWNMQVGYRFTSIKDNTAESEREKNVAWLQLRYAYPVFD